MGKAVFWSILYSNGIGVSMYWILERKYVKYALFAPEKAVIPVIFVPFVLSGERSSM